MKKLVLGLIVVGLLASCGSSNSYHHSCSKQNKRYVHNSFINM